jgi:hypothetical protein
MNVNSGKSWSEMDITDLKHSVEYGDTIAETASVSCRDEDEVRVKMKELGRRAAGKARRSPEQIFPQHD